VVVWAAWVDFNLRKSTLRHLSTCPRSISSFPTSPYLHNCHLYTHSQYSPLSRSTLSTMVSDFCRINDIFELILCVRIYRQVVRLRSYHRPCSITRDDTVRVATKKTRGNSPLKRLYSYRGTRVFQAEHSNENGSANSQSARIPRCPWI
jgi:hypothetical protein